MDGRAHGVASSPTRMAATTSRTPSWRWTRAARSWACASTPSPISAPISRRSPRCADLSVRACCCRASTPSPPIYVEVDVGLHQHRAGRRLSRRRARRKRPLCSSASSNARRVRPGDRSGRVPPAELHHQCLPAPDARHRWSTTSAITSRRSTRRWAGRLQGLPARARRRRQPRASCAASAFRPISKPAASRPRRAIGALGAGVGAAGNWRKCGSTRLGRSRF